MTVTSSRGMWKWILSLVVEDGVCFVHVSCRTHDTSEEASGRCADLVVNKTPCAQRTFLVSGRLKVTSTSQRGATSSLTTGASTDGGGALSFCSRVCFVVRRAPLRFLKRRKDVETPRDRPRVVRRSVEGRGPRDRERSKRSVRDMNNVHHCDCQCWLLLNGVRFVMIWTGQIQESNSRVSLWLG